MTTRDALQEAISRDSVDDAMGVLIEREVWMADADTLTQAIHSVYCGIMADHDQPNDKDREQAKQLIAAIGRSHRDGGRGDDGVTAPGALASLACG